MVANQNRQRIQMIATSTQECQGNLQKQVSTLQIKHNGSTHLGEPKIHCKTKQQEGSRYPPFWNPRKNPTPHSSKKYREKPSPPSSYTRNREAIVPHLGEIFFLPILPTELISFYSLLASLLCCSSYFVVECWMMIKWERVPLSFPPPSLFSPLSPVVSTIHFWSELDP